MPDLEELEPINESSEGLSSTTQTQQTKSSLRLEITHLLVYLEHKIKVVLLFILLSGIASFLILNHHPSPSLPSQQSQNQITTTTQSSLPLTFPSLEDSTSNKITQSSIFQLTSEIRMALDEILTQAEPTTSQLKFIQENLLNNKKKIEEKMQHHKNRIKFFEEKSKIQYFGALKLQKYNGRLEKGEREKTLKKDEENQYNELNYNYHFDQIRAEIPICIITYATKTKKPYASDYFLTSIKNQNYSNYKVVLILDDPDEQTSQMWKTSLYYLNSSKVELILHKEHIGYWQSLKSAINNPCCSKAEVIALMNGNDELLGFNVLTSLNSAYQLKQANVAYSNFIEYHADFRQFLRGFSNRYSQEQTLNSKYRELPIGFGSILSFRKHLFSYISDESVQLQSEYSTQFAIEISLYFCLLQLSCGKIEYIPQYFYLFEGYKFIGNSREVLEKYLGKLKEVRPYKCYKYYQQ